MSIVGMFISAKKGSFLTGVNGLNMMALLFLGVGPLCYIFFPIDERGDKIVSPQTVMQLFALIAPYFISGYTLSLLIQLFMKSSDGSKTLYKELLVPSDQLLKTLAKGKILFFILSTVGYMLAKLEISSSGLGTLFPVFKSFLYPNMVLSIYTLNTKNSKSLLMMLLICSVGFYFAVTSWWRSELIMASGAIVIGLLLKSKRAIVPVIILGLFGILYILPFQQVKKFEYERTKKDLTGTFLKTLQLSLDERVAFASMFFAERINYGREISYAQNGLNKGYVQYRNGMSYLEVVLQLIPRVIWTDKPSFNTYNNRERAMKLGLIGDEDEFTAWGVNIYAEFILNFNFFWLVFFVPAVMLLFRWLDHLAIRLSEDEVIRFMITVTLFFISFEMVSLLFTSTFILWCFIVAKLFENVLRMRWRKPITSSI
jgi:hypothetical protein